MTSPEHQLKPIHSQCPSKQNDTVCCLHIMNYVGNELRPALLLLKGDTQRSLCSDLWVVEVYLKRGTAGELSVHSLRSEEKPSLKTAFTVLLCCQWFYFVVL